MAKQLEGERLALRLSADEWLGRMFADPYDAAKRAAVEGWEWEIAQRALRLGVNVILEWGFWSRSERDEIRAQAAAQGADTELYFLDVTREELSRRLALRNASQVPGEVRVDEEQLALWWTLLEPPTPDEFKSNG